MRIARSGSRQTFDIRGLTHLAGRQLGSRDSVGVYCCETRSRPPGVDDLADNPVAPGDPFAVIPVRPRRKEHPMMRSSPSSRRKSVSLGSLILIVGLASFRPIELVGEEKPASTPLSPEHAAQMVKGLDLFKKTVGPMLVGRCVRCHGGEKTEAEFDVTNREKLLKGGAEGPVWVPGSGKGEASRLYRVVAHLEEPFMPEGGTDKDFRRIRIYRCASYPKVDRKREQIITYVINAWKFTGPTDKVGS